ncbi:MAG: hypothetical protein M9922_12135 [Microthrixaceae bacterium]|nr:hypothetical protein [Microthrixaceae bacterium]
MTSLSEAPTPRERAFAHLTDRCLSETGAWVDEFGLAATFESWGITDSIALSRFGEPDVFSLAEEMHTRLEGAEYAERGSTPRAPLVRSSWLLRAVAYLPPTLFVAIALSSPGTIPSGAVFAAITCIGWGLAEASSRVAYTSINVGGVAAMRAPNRLLLLWGTLAVLVVGGITGALAGSVAPALLVGAQLQYLLLSVILLPMGRVSTLVLWVTPAMLVAGISTVGTDELWTVLAVAAICELGATVHTWLVLGRLEPTRLGAPGRSELGAAVPFLGSGIVMGAFVLCCTAVVYAAVGSGAALVGLVAPLLVSMGLAEIGLRWFQRAVATQLGRAGRVTQFAHRARLLVLVSCVGYVVVLLSADLLMAAFTGPPAFPVGLPGYVLIGLVGLCLFLTLVLMVMDHVFAVLAAFSGGAVALVWLLVVLDSAAEVVVPAVVVAALVACYLLIVTLRTVGHPANHAFA